MINMDDTEVPYNEIFDPKIEEFYGADSLPMQIFSYSEMKK